MTLFPASPGLSSEFLSFLLYYDERVSTRHLLVTKGCKVFASAPADELVVEKIDGRFLTGDLTKTHVNDLMSVSNLVFLV